MRIRRALAMVAIAALGGASSLLVGCGSDSKKLIPSGDANALNSNLDAIANAVTAGRCAAASSKLTDLRSDLNRLPSTIDPDLRHNLEEAYAVLAKDALRDCRARTQTTTTETTPTTTTETTPTTTTETTTVTVPATTTTQTTTTAPTTTIPTTTTGTGGTTIPTGTVPSPTPEPKK
jgi:outer membrane murein-binding lipoprotein Lpp